MEKLYGCFRITTEVFNPCTDDEEIGDSNVYFVGILDYEHAKEHLDKQREFDAKFYKKVEVIRDSTQEYKVRAYYSDKYAVEITEYFDNFTVNNCIGQPIFEQACI